MLTHVGPEWVKWELGFVYFFSLGKWDLGHWGWEMRWDWDLGKHLAGKWDVGNIWARKWDFACSKNFAAKIW